MGYIGCHPHDLLTATNSPKELMMVDANSKSRPKKEIPVQVAD